MGLYLVTGANGFIGSHVSERLAAGGHRVRALVRRTSDLTWIEGLKVEIHVGDVTEAASLDAPLAGVEVVVHVAGLASDWGPYSRFHQVNVAGTRNVAEAARRAGVRRLVHIGTTAVHGFSGFRDLAESAPMAETPFPYCETKKEAERWLMAFAAGGPMEAVTIRPGNVYGPKDHTFILKYLDALRARKLGYVDGGRHLTAPVYVGNLVDAILAACRAEGAAGEAFFITDGLSITWREFTEAFAARLGEPPPRLSIPYSLAYGIGAASEALYRLLRIFTPPLVTRYRASNGGRDYHFSIHKARRILGYEPAVGFSEAVRMTVEWYRDFRGLA